MDNPSLSDNLVQDLAGVALHLFGKDDPGTIRNVRHLIARYGGQARPIYLELHRPARQLVAR